MAAAGETSLITEDRPLVVWVGPPPAPELQAELESFGLHLAVVADCNSVQRSESLRAVLVWVPESGVSKIAETLTPIMRLREEGVLIRAVPKDLKRSIETGRITQLDAALKALGLGYTENDPRTLLRICIDHRPRQKLLGSVSVAVEGEAELDPIDEILIRRLFGGYLGPVVVTLKRLTGGLSGAIVWKAKVDDSGGCCEPVIVKVGPKHEIRHERRMYDELVRNFVPFINRPGNMREGFVEGSERAAIAQFFVEATRFDEWIAGREDAGRAVSRLLDGPLRTWRLRRQQQRGSIGSRMVSMLENTTAHPEDRAMGQLDRGILVEWHNLNEAYQASTDSGLTVPTPPELCDLLRNSPEIDYWDCVSHGDLNARNVFVRDTSDVVLIDFSHVGSSPASRDMSRLETATTLDVAIAGQHLPLEVLDDLYTDPMRRDLRIADPRVEVALAIRARVAREEISPSEWRLIEACHLLRFARATKQAPLDRKAWAYSAASKLIQI